MCFDSGNLLPVAQALRIKHQNARILVCADDDQFTDGNPGMTKATEAAKAVNGEVVSPKFTDLSTRPTDFNDLAVLEGIKAAKKQIPLEHGKTALSWFVLQTSSRNQ